MRKLVVLVIALSATLAAVKIADACGDKTMRIGRSIRFHQAKAAKNPSSILIQASALPKGNASRVSDFLKAVGHKSVTFNDVGSLSQNLRTNHYDLVITDLASAPDLERQVASVSPKTVVVPVTFNQPKSEQAVAERQYKVMVKDPEYAEDFLGAVNQVMKSRSKRA